MTYCVCPAPPVRTDTQSMSELWGGIVQGAQPGGPPCLGIVLVADGEQTRTVRVSSVGLGFQVVTAGSSRPDSF